MKRITILLSIILAFGSYGVCQSPASHPAVSWAINDDFSDEFNANELDLVKWDRDVRDWGTWSWEPSNAYLTDSALTLRMVHDQHIRSNRTFYFTSGILRNRETTTYGYFETRIKASAKGQGTCPAFWMYSVGQPVPTEEGGVQYSEIDVIEIFQVPYDTQRLEMNLHARIIEDGTLTWKRPGQGDRDLTHNTWLAPWDPRDEYHTYGVWNRLDSIFWYVDGVQRGAKKNYYWHLPMHLTVSMGLRTPYERYIRGVRTVMPFPDSVPEPGFPTEMFCDYVRVWETPPQIYADREQYHGASFPLNDDLEFKVRYFAGSGAEVEDSAWSGISCKLQEVRPDGSVVQEIELNDPSAIGKESGLATFQFSLAGLMPSANLPAGHQYILKPSFYSSFQGGQEVNLEEEYYPIQLLQASNLNQSAEGEPVKIHYVTEGIEVMRGREGGTPLKLVIHDLAGREIYSSHMSGAKVLIKQDVFQSKGIYNLLIKGENYRQIEKLLIQVN